MEEEANIYGFLGPLSTVVWMYTGALYLFMSFILVLIARSSLQLLLNHSLTFLTLDCLMKTGRIHIRVTKILLNWRIYGI